MTYEALRAVLRRANEQLGTNWSMHDLRHTCALRMLRDKDLTLRDVQVILGHAHLTTTQVYLEEDDHEVIRRVHQHLTTKQEPTPQPSPAAVPAGYTEADLAVLLGDQAMTAATTAMRKQPQPRLASHDHLTEANRTGSGNGLTVGEVLALPPQLPTWSGLAVREQTRRLRGAEAILTWLLTFPGEGWQQRWVAAGADENTRWIDTVPFNQSRSAATRRIAITGGVNGLLLCRAVLPSYQFLAAFRPLRLYENVRQVFQPEPFAPIQQAATAAGMRPRDLAGGLAVISKMVLHTGRDPGELTVEDIYQYRSHGVRLDRRGHSPHGVHAA